MAVQKVTYGGTTLIDLTADTATAADVLQSKTFHKADGTIATGSIAKLAAQTFTPTTADQTIAAGKYLDGAQTIKGDANLVASNIASGVSIFGVVGTFAGGGGSEIKSLIERTITSYADSSVSVIGNAAFCGCTSLQTISFPNCTDIKNSAFMYCSALTSVEFPRCTSLAMCFGYCTHLAQVSFPLATYLATTGFADLSNLTTAYLPALLQVLASTFRSCSKLTDVTLTSATLISTNAFASCFSLSTLSLPKIAKFSGSSVFLRCYRLVSLYLLGSSVAQLQYSNTFSSTPIAGYTASTGGVYGSIFVPASLYSAYIASTNWVTFSSRFVSV